MGYSSRVNSGDENAMEWVNAMNGLSAALVQQVTGKCFSALSTSKSSCPPTAASVAEFKAAAAVLEGNRWYIRKAANLPTPVIIRPEAINQALAIEDSTKLAVKIDGKINAIIADKCARLDIEVVDVIANVELLNCNDCRVFLTGHVPTMVLDGCDCVQIFVSVASKDIKIYHSKSCDIITNWPAGILDPKLSGEASEYQVEIPIPSQLLTCLGNNGKVVTEPASHIGA